VGSKMARREMKERPTLWWITFKGNGNTIEVQSQIQIHYFVRIIEDSPSLAHLAHGMACPWDLVYLSKVLTVHLGVCCGPVLCLSINKRKHPGYGIVVQNLSNFETGITCFIIFVGSIDGQLVRLLFGWRFGHRWSCHAHCVVDGLLASQIHNGSDEVLYKDEK
jgi:hypothetical protein